MITYVLAIILAAAAQAPARDSLLAEGVRLAAMEPAAALVRFETLLSRDSTDATANWRAAVALNDVAQPLTASGERTRRDSLYARAEGYARRAVRLTPNDARALFSLGLVLGNLALSRGIRERVRMATEIRDLALRALAADSTHDGAHHLLGRWNYEIMRLSGVSRFIARSILDGGVFGKASWEEARRELERAVELDPTRIYHRLDLARVYVARKEVGAARRELRKLAELPDKFAADPSYRRQAAELRARVDGSQP